MMVMMAMATMTTMVAIRTMAHGNEEDADDTEGGDDFGARFVA